MSTSSGLGPRAQRVASSGGAPIAIYSRRGGGLEQPPELSQLSPSAFIIRAAARNPRSEVLVRAARDLPDDHAEDLGLG